jgi:hypothetical protein
MKRLLLSLCIVGAVFPGHTPNLLQTRSSSVTAERVVAALVSARLPDPATQGSTQEPRPWFERVAVRSRAMTGEDTPSTSLPPRDSQSAPLPTTSEGSETTPPSSPEEANWVVVIRWATVHSGPSVSAPTVRFCSVGTELHLIGYWDGWFQVFDPVTSERGWIYAKYYLQAIRGPGQGIVALQALAKPQQKVVNTTKSAPHVRRANKTGPRPVKENQPLVASAPRHRYETVASILERALRP